MEQTIKSTQRRGRLRRLPDHAVPASPLSVPLRRARAKLACTLVIRVHVFTKLGSPFVGNILIIIKKENMKKKKSHETIPEIGKLAQKKTTFLVLGSLRW